MNNNGSITIFEASRLTGKSQTTIHRYIKKGVLQVKTGLHSGKQVLTVEKADLERVFNIPCNTGCNSVKQGVNHCATGVLQVETGVKQSEESLTAERIRQVMEDFFESKQTQLMKPLEEQSIFLAGRLTQENQFLKQRLETVLQEVEQYKALPSKIQEREEEIKTIENRLKQEKEEALKEQEARLKAEIEQALKQAEEEKKQIVDIWKKELEEAKKPWWKFW